MWQSRAAPMARRRHLRGAALISSPMQRPMAIAILAVLAGRSSCGKMRKSPWLRYEPLQNEMHLPWASVSRCLRLSPPGPSPAGSRRALLRLSARGATIRRGADMQMPEMRGYAEAEALSRSLASLVADLKQPRTVARGARTRHLRLRSLSAPAQLAVAERGAVQAYIEAEKATEAKSRFLAAASHDLRQPLHAMSLFARALSQRVSGEEAPRLIEQLEEALASLKGMFEALLNMSRLDAGLIQPDLTEVSTNTLIDRVSSGFRMEAEGRALRFVSRSAEAQLRTDPALVETMLRNLISNALKFTRRGGVALIARRSGDAIAIEVVDTGPGIAEDRRERIFDEFERAREQAAGTMRGWVLASPSSAAMPRFWELPSNCLPVRAMARASH